MAQPRHPAAYLRAGPGADPGALARQHQVVAEAARQRAWPAPVVYSDDDPGLADRYGPALAKLEAAIVAGRHDALLLAGPGMASGSMPALLMRLLFDCTKNGVTVEILPSCDPAADSPAADSPAADSPAVIPEPAAELEPGAGRMPPFPLPREHWSVLTRACIEALSGVFPDWRIWLDHHGWHARRRASTYLQGYWHGAPAFCVHADTAVDLAAQLRWQQSAEAHAPSGCRVG